MLKKHNNQLKVFNINPKRFEKTQIKFYCYLIPLAILMGLPIVFILCNAFKPMDELLTYPPKLITLRPTLDNFKMLIATSNNKAIPASRYLFNSIVTSVCVVFFTLVITSASAYCMAKKKYKLKNFLFAVNTAALMFVQVAVAIPRYFIIYKLGLVDNFWVHILPLLAMPVGLFLVKQFIDQFPDSIVEAAQIDGSSDFKILTRMVIPNITPALATVAILAFQTSWNSMEASNYYINNEALKTFAFYMSTLTATTGNANAMVGALSGNAIAGLGVQAAASTIMFLPNLLLFIFLQSRVMNTMSHSGMK